MRITLAAMLFVAALNQASAQIQLDRFYPPVVAAGSETSVKAEGKFPIWPLKVVCDRDDVQVATGEASGQLKFTVPAGAAPGIAWIRFHDAKSASQLVPLCVESIAATEEVEPNNKIADASKIELPGLVYGRLEKSGDIDTYRVAIRQGQTLVVSTIANEILGSPMDAVLQLVDDAGNVLVQSDDVRGLDPQIAHVAGADSDVIVRIFAFPETPNSTIGYAGAASFLYLLRITTDSFVDHALPLVRAEADAPKCEMFGWNLKDKIEPLSHESKEVASSTVFTSQSLGWQSQLIMGGAATSIVEPAESTVSEVESLPCIFSGHITSPGEVDRLRFAAKKGTKYRATVYSASLGFPLDSVLRVVNTADGGELARNDDQKRDQDDAGIEFTSKDDAEYELQISDLVDGHGLRHAYSIVLEEAKPTAVLSLSADHFTLVAGQAVEVPVAVDRRSGFDQPLSITAHGLPDGVTAESVTSEIKGDTSKAVKLKLTADKSAAEFSGTFQVLARRANTEAGTSEESFVAKFPLSGQSSVSNVWLTVAIQ